MTASSRLDSADRGIILEENRFRPAGRKRPTLGMRIGKITLRVRRVEDTVTGGTFFQLWQNVLFDNQRIHQPDVITLPEQLT